jgi:hypothetical protein
LGFLDLFRGSEDARIARQYIKALRDAGERRRLEFDSAERLVIAYDGEGQRAQIHFIGNLVREILAAPIAGREAIYQRYVLSSIESEHGERPADYEFVKSNLRVLLKDSGYPDFIALLNATDFPDSERAPLVFEPVVGDVIACCVQEENHGLRFVTESDLAQWRVDAATALADAKANVSALPFQISEPQPGRFVFNDDSFIASRFVNTRMFDDLPVRGEWVAVIPDRNTFFVSDSEDLDTMASLALLAKQQLEAGERIISGLPFVLREGRWQVHEPAGPLRPLFANVALQYRASYWAEFKSALEKDLERRGQDIFVASLTVREEPPAGAYYCMAVWSKDVDTILPVVDRLYFFDREANTTRAAPWAAVVGVMEAEMAREGGLPERYRVKSFPSAEQFAAMGAKVIRT